METPSCDCSLLPKMKVSLTKPLALRLLAPAEGTSCFVEGCVWCQPSAGNQGGWVCSFPHNVGYFDWWLSCVQDRVYFSKEDHQKGRNRSEEVCPQRGDVCLWTPALWKDQRKVGRELTAQVSCRQADVRCSGPMPRFFFAGIVRVATLRTRKR